MIKNLNGVIYNKIFMAEEDIAKTTFRYPGAIGLFEWVVMTFGLKNAGATYQREMNYIFHKLIGRIVEIYIDDVMIKSKGYKEHLADLRETLECTRKHGLKMNPKSVILECQLDNSWVSWSTREESKLVKKHESN